MFDMESHLRERGLNVERYSGVFLSDDSVTFSLWNLSGMMVGHQTYSPLKPKTPQENPRDQKYFTYVTKVDKHVALAV